MTDTDIFAQVAAMSNLRFDQTEGRYVIDIPEDANIAIDTIGRHAKGDRADHTALIFEELDGSCSRFTYAELDSLSDRFAVTLSSLGVARGEPVAVGTGQTPETAIAHMAIYKLGAVVLTLSQLYWPDAGELILKDSRPPFLIPERETWDRLAAARDPFLEALVPLLR